MITKRSLIAETALVISLLGACVYGFVRMKQQVEPVHSSVILCVVPPDALVVQQYHYLHDLCETYVSEKTVFSHFCASDNGLSLFLRQISDLEGGESPLSKLLRAEGVFSVHYTGKNTLNVLLGVDFKEFAEWEKAFEKLCLELGGATLYKRYNKVDVFQIYEAKSLLYIAQVDGFLLAGTSPVVVESAIRHLVSGRSLMDNHLFESLVTPSSTTYESSVYVNIRQADKLFTSLMGKRMLPHADFFSQSASWIALHGNTSGDFAQLHGYLLTDKGEADYFSTIGSQIPSPVKLWEAVPSSTLAFFSFSPSDFDKYLKQYGNYLEIHKKDKKALAQAQAWEAKTETHLNEWFASLSAAEVALAWIPVKEGRQWLTLVRTNNIQQAKKHLGFPAGDGKQPPPVLPNPAQGAFVYLFGSLFGKSTESYYTIVDNHLYFGPQELLESIVSGGFDKNSSLSAMLKQLSVKGKWMDESGFTCVLNAASVRDSLLDMWDSRYTSMIKEALAPYDYALTIFQVASIGGRPYANLLFSADNYKLGRTSAKAPSKDAIDTAPLPMAIGSFRIFNHASRKNDQIEQAADSTLILKDASGKQTWRTRRKYAIVDQVGQIDFYKNDKLQMLFVSEGNELCLLDILGRLVTGFPKALPVPVRKGPFVFDLKSNKDYDIFMIHTDNSLRLYDQTVTEVEGWGPFVPEDRIETKPVLLRHVNDYFWLIYGTEKDYILHHDGSIAVVLQKSNRIKQDAEITIDKDGVLNGTTTEGRILTVQLSSGTIKTRRP